jgi:REP element-mobilizing transposase RayT
MRQRRRQLALDLREACGWGGRREGAGRPPGIRPRIRHRSRDPFPGRYPCMVTLKARPGLPALRNAALVRELERTFRAARERGAFRLIHYSLQHDHIHLIVEANGREALARGMKAIAARFARAVNRVFHRGGRVLADRYHLCVLRSPREVRARLAYVLLNHRKHARHAPRAALGDPASSGRWFDGWSTSPCPRARANAQRDPPVAPPRTWLLRLGWRRHGLIDPREVPGRRR